MMAAFTTKLGRAGRPRSRCRSACCRAVARVGRAFGAGGRAACSACVQGRSGRSLRRRRTIRPCRRRRMTSRPPGSGVARAWRRLRGGVARGPRGLFCRSPVKCCVVRHLASKVKGVTPRLITPTNKADPVALPEQCSGRAEAAAPT